MVGGFSRREQDSWKNKTKASLQKNRTFQALAKSDHSSAIADHVKTTGHNIKWDNFETF